MFDIGWTELVVIACIAIIVVGPKDLPKMLRAFGKTMGSLRRMAGDFQRQFDDALKEAELDEVKKIATKQSFQPLEDIKKSTREYEQKVRDEMNRTKAEINSAGDDPGAVAESPSAKPAPAKPEVAKPEAAKPAGESAAAASDSGPAAKPAESASGGGSKNA